MGERSLILTNESFENIDYYVLLIKSLIYLDNSQNKKKSISRKEKKSIQHASL